MTSLDARSYVNQVADLVESARSAVAADAGASPVLRAVVDELGRKSDKAKKAVGSGGEPSVAVVELEQAADSAKAAAEADTGLSEAARAAVLEAHLSACTWKFGLDAPGSGAAR